MFLGILPKRGSLTLRPSSGVSSGCAGVDLALMSPLPPQGLHCSALVAAWLPVPSPLLPDKPGLVLPCACTAWPSATPSWGPRRTPRALGRTALSSLRRAGNRASRPGHRALARSSLLRDCFPCAGAVLSLAQTHRGRPQTTSTRLYAEGELQGSPVCKGCCRHQPSNNCSHPNGVPEGSPGKAGISGLHSRLPLGVRPRLEGKPRTPLSS